MCRQPDCTFTSAHAKIYSFTTYLQVLSFCIIAAYTDVHRNVVVQVWAGWRHASADLGVQCACSLDRTQQFGAQNPHQH